VSEHTPEQAGKDTGVDAATTAGATEPNMAAEPGIDAPSIAPDHEAPPKADPVKADATPDAVKTESKAEPKPGKLIVMPPSGRDWDREAPHVEAEQREIGSKRGVSAMAAVVALAAAVGAISGALATAGVMHFASAAAPAQLADNSALEASVARLDADVVALKANVEHTAKAGVTQFNKTTDRIEKLEKAQAEPAARLAKLSETVEKLRLAQAAAPAQATATKEATGSIAPTQVAAAGPVAMPAPAAPAQAAAPAAVPPKVEVGRLPTVEGWRLRDVANGGALIEGRRGLYEVYAGDPVPGLGRVEAIRRQDGRWVVVTSRGLIVAR
jgi:hypothetical protein